MSTRDELIGRVVLGRYRVVRRLAKGGMGVVYLGRAEGAAGFVKPVVIKRMLTEIADDAMERMFVREARILSRLQHPGIVSVLDFGQEDGAYLLVMEYVHGFHVGRWNRYVRKVRGPMPAPLAIHIVIHVLDALHYAHTRKRSDGEPLGIVHRDVSPSNVLIDEEGHVKLLDFGIARASGDTEEYKTQDTTVKGKLAYLPPEMFQGETPSPLTDVYSCGVLLHELLIGKNEFRGSEMSETLGLVLTHQPTPVTTVRDDVPGAVDDIVARALAKHPDGRFADAEAFAQALREVRGLSEEGADALLADQVGRDFPLLPQILDCPSLIELEESWRNPPRVDPTGGTESPPPAPSSDDPTEALAAGTPRPPRRAPRLVIALASVLAVAVGGALALRSEGSSPAREVVVIQQQRGTEGGTVNDGPADAPGRATEETGDDGEAPAGAAAGEDAGEPREPRETRRVRRPSAGPDALSAAFARQSGRIQACFAQHTENLSGSPRISIRFSIDRAGHVQRAELLPAALAPTPVGQCLLGVARSTEFGPRDAPATFRIPITARRTP